MSTLITAFCNFEDHCNSCGERIVCRDTHNCMDNWKFHISGRMAWTWKYDCAQLNKDKNIPGAKAKHSEKVLMAMKFNL